MRVCSVCQRCYDDLEFSCVIESHPTPAEFRSGYPEMIPGFKLDRMRKAENGEQTYEALHLESGHPCLVHIYRGSEQLAEKFLGDADAVKALFHPNIADVYEAGLLDDGGYFVVSELAEGQTFSELLRTRGVPELLDAITLVRQAAEAVHAIHLKGLFHRAINSDNIFITHDVDGRQTVKLVGIDLGGVAQNSMVADKFSIDSAVDRLRYFAPELFGGEAASLKTDIYALGVVFYEMLAGHTPFTAATASGLVEMHRNSPPADIRIDDFELRMLITHTLTESLMKRPEKRQTSANAFARQLRHIEQLSTHVSTPPPAIKVAELPHISPARVEMNIADEVIPVSPVVHEKEVAVPLVIDESISEPPAVAESIQKPRTKRVRRKKRHSPVVVPVVEHEVQQIAPVMLERPKSVAAAAAATAVTPSRKKVELPQLDDDIPTMADVLEELSKEPVSTASLELHREAAHAPTPIETQSKVNDPKIETREPQAPVEVNDLPQQPIAAQLPAQKPPGKKQPKRAAPQPSDLEEITARPTRIRVPIERPRRERRPAFARAAFSHSTNDVMFFPTMLGSSRSTQESDDAEAGGMMSAFYTDAATSRFAQYRPYAAGGAVIAVMAIVLWAFSSTQDASNEVANETTPVPNSVIQQSQPSEVLAPQTTAVKTSVVKNADKPLSVVSASPLNAVKPKEEKSEKKSDVKVRPDADPKTAKSSSNNSRPAEVKRSVKKQSSPLVNKPTGSTRPRIVMNGKP